MWEELVVHGYHPFNSPIFQRRLSLRITMPLQCLRPSQSPPKTGGITRTISCNSSTLVSRSLICVLSIAISDFGGDGFSAGIFIRKVSIRSFLVFSFGLRWLIEDFRLEMRGISTGGGGAVRGVTKLFDGTVGGGRGAFRGATSPIVRIGTGSTLICMASGGGVVDGLGGLAEWDVAAR